MFKSMSFMTSRSSGPTDVPSNFTIAVFCSDDHPSRAHEMAFTSWWRVTSQKPPSS